MKSLKIAALSLFMLVANFTWAQQNNQNSKTPEERATEHSTMLTQKLGLSADQQKSVYTACLQRAQQNEADRTKYQGDREGMRAARKQSNDAFDASMDKILTADQKTKYQQLKQEEEAKRKQGGGRQRGGE
ncbi:MAG TPA: hypothetical protein VKG26_02420 [Bacteroidia bacterium]|nr:hypothetical protein [Bacteroidia bacterium]